MTSIDILKVDKAFVDRLTTDTKDAASTSAILAMSSSLNLATVAEGVEEHSQAQWLANARCQYGQGYLWSRPVPFDAAKELLTTRVAKELLTTQVAKDLLTSRVARAS
ncbi:MAG: EAL domain-containing protein [Actinomycetota bacterium]|nr:EAL domain-containing protein [Actinomycetota bacterium]